MLARSGSRRRGLNRTVDVWGLGSFWGTACLQRRVTADGERGGQLSGTTSDASLRPVQGWTGNFDKGEADGSLPLPHSALAADDLGDTLMGHPQDPRHGGHRQAVPIGGADGASLASRLAWSLAKVLSRGRASGAWRCERAGLGPGTDISFESLEDGIVGRRADRRPALRGRFAGSGMEARCSWIVVASRGKACAPAWIPGRCWLGFTTRSQSR